LKARLFRYDPRRRNLVQLATGRPRVCGLHERSKHDCRGENLPRKMHGRDVASPSPMGQPFKLLCLEESARASRTIGTEGRLAPPFAWG
jgi:hypothetical protein